MVDVGLVFIDQHCHEFVLLYLMISLCCFPDIFQSHVRLALAQMPAGSEQLGHSRLSPGVDCPDINDMSQAGPGSESEAHEDDQKTTLWRGQDYLLGLTWMPPMVECPCTPEPPKKKICRPAFDGPGVPAEWNQTSKKVSGTANYAKLSSTPMSPMKTPLKSDEPLPTQGSSFNLHAYAVWWHPMCDTGFDYRGVHAGGTSAWAYIMSWLPNGQYGGSKVRLRRFPNVDSAVEGYQQEFRQHKAPSIPKLWHH